MRHWGSMLVSGAAATYVIGGCCNPPQPPSTYKPAPSIVSLDRPCAHGITYEASDLCTRLETADHLPCVQCAGDASCVDATRVYCVAVGCIPDEHCRLKPGTELPVPSVGAPKKRRRSKEIR